MGIHGKIDGHHLVFLQWIGCEYLVNDFADWVAGSLYEGPVFVHDDFSRRKSRYSAPRPDNYPAPEPSGRMRVSATYQDVPCPASLIYVGEETPVEVADLQVSLAPEGCIVVYDLGNLGIARQGIPLLHCGNQVAMQLI